MNGDQGTKIPSGRTYGVGDFHISSGGATQDAMGPNSATNGIAGAPITYLGDRVVTTSSDATYSGSGIELFTPTGAVETESLTVDATGGYPTSILALGNYLYVEMTGGLAQLRTNASGSGVTLLSPAIVPIGGSAAMSGILLHPASTTITSHPPTVVKTPASTYTAKFKFTSDEYGTFSCKVDGGSFTTW
jgi:hypothetical protein